MFITGLGTAVPPQQFKQSEGWEAVQLAAQFETLTEAQAELEIQKAEGWMAVEIQERWVNPRSKRIAR